jgi:hypothetical protein
MISTYAADPIKLYVRLVLDFVTNRDGERSCCQYNYTNVWLIEKWVWNKVIANAILRCLNYSLHGNKMQTLRSHYLIEDRFAQLKEKLKHTHKKRFTYGMPFNMQLERRGGCLASMFIIGKGEYPPTIYVSFKTCEIPKKFFADLCFINLLIEELGLAGCPVVLTAAARFYWLLPSQAFIPMLGMNRIKNPVILNSGFFKGKYEYRGVASLKENNELLVKEYGEWIKHKGLLNKYLIHNGLDV